MNLKILFMFLIYYSFISLIFIFGSSYMSGFSTTINMNDTSLNSGDIDKGGFFTTGVSFTRYLAFIGFGIGLSADTPSWFQIVYSAFAVAMNIFLIAWIVSSVWDG